MPFGQLLLGPPGSGKTTYIRRFHSLYTSMSRPVASINLDPANDQLQDFEFDLDIRELITLQDVMDEFGLGPNAGNLTITLVKGRLDLSFVE
jgi:GTPase SAR1 family protein